MIDYLIVNAGTHPEPAHLAAGLVARGNRVRYLTSATIASNSLPGRVARSSGPVRLPLSAELAKRVLPLPIGADNVVHRAVGPEAVSQLIRRIAPANFDAAVRRRVALFDAAAARYVAKHRPGVVVGQQTCTRGAFRAAGDAVKVLNYPIAHHDWIDRTMAVESRLNPDWKGSLQGNDLSAEDRAWMDEEIDLADYILVASSFVKRTFVEAGINEEKLLVEPLGADLRQFGAAGHDENPSAGRHALRVLFAGQLTQRKGLSYLLDAFQAAAVPDAVLRLVGLPVGDVLAHIPTVRGVEVRGPVSRAELGEQYRWADVVVLPSLAEGFGLTALEAMACGTPCIVTTSTFADDVVEEGVSGFVVAPSDVEALRSRLVWASSHPDDLEGIGRAAARRAQEFTWERYQRAAAAQIEGVAR